MKNKHIKDTVLILDLQLFNDGGAGTGTGDGAASTGETGVAAVPQRKGAKNAAPEIRYGIQEGDVQVADAQTTADTESAKTTTQAQDRNAAFEELIKGEYKDLFDARMQDVIQKRLKTTKETVDKYEALSPTLDLLFKKYGVKDGDVSALSRAIEEDDTFFEEEAMRRNMSVENLREMRKIERENEELRRASKDREARENADRLYSAWMTQTEEAKKVYPGIDLKTELNNPKFVSLLRSNIDVRTAYEVIHKDEIIPAAMQFAVQSAEKQIVNSIASGKRRINENGASAQSPAMVKSDVTQLTRADRENIRKQVAGGARIKF